MVMEFEYFFLDCFRSTKTKTQKVRPKKGCNTIGCLLFDDVLSAFTRSQMGFAFKCGSSFDNFLYILGN